MLRGLTSLANATPADYLSGAPSRPELFALQLIEKATRLFPVPNRDDGVMREPNYQFLYIGPGCGNVIQVLLDQGQRAYGIEPSRRGIQSGPEEVRSYISWVKPWESPYAQLRGDPPTPYQMFHIGIINKFLKTYFTPEEWARTVAETKKCCRVVFTI